MIDKNVLILLITLTFIQTRKAPLLLTFLIYDICVAGENHHQYSDSIFHSIVYMCINVDNIPVSVYHDE